MTAERITIVIETSGAAFEGYPEGEVARILQEIVARMLYSGIPPVPRDINGNVCGSVTVESI